MLSRGRWVVLVAAVAVSALTARLGLWQLDRAGEKQAREALLAVRDQAPPLSLGELPAGGRVDTALAWRRAELQGRWLAQHTVFLDNRQMGGRPGFYVVTPLLLASGDAVLVQRGWVPRHFQDRTALPEVPTPDVPVRLLVRVAPPPAKLLELGEGTGGRIRQNLDPEGYSREIGVALRGWSAVQLDLARPLGETPEAAADGLRRDWPAPASDVSKHHGYAVQWFSLSALTIGLYVWFQLIQPRRRARANA